MESRILNEMKMVSFRFFIAHFYAGSWTLTTNELNRLKSHALTEKFTNNLVKKKYRKRSRVNRDINYLK